MRPGRTPMGTRSRRDTPWQSEMEASFPYEETIDQLRATAEVKADMERPVPMDRLVVGDVGYGKTEVALRAAFKATQDDKQVAVLVPTTVLAAQHHATFGQRFAAFPLEVRILSRFVSAKDQAATIAGLGDGSVDVVIGTHRLLSKDVRFRDLGLVVVDEEQRFGVAAKEKLKQLRREVDVLTLSATPIPRTLNLAMAGIRDLSVIETPPEDRLPIQTRVAEASAGLVRDAILRELDRGGQVFYVHNRVETIEAQAEQLRRLLPDARFVVGHGQMPEGALEKVMIAFAAGEADVLVSTTIIESGLDIPNANTIIIDRADTLGLAQLYQLRGRVGRSSRRAYAYLLYRRRERLSDEARKRLQAIFNASELGAGFQIALSDLEIRGAGNILGGEQSGHMAAVGFDLYSRMLAEAVEAQKAIARGPGADRRGAAGRGRPASRCASARRLRARRGAEARAVSAVGARPVGRRRGCLPPGGHGSVRSDAGIGDATGRGRGAAAGGRSGRRVVDLARGGSPGRAVRGGADARGSDAAPRRWGIAGRPSRRRDVRLEPGPHPRADRSGSRVAVDPGRGRPAGSGVSTGREGAEARDREPGQTWTMTLSQAAEVAPGPADAHKPSRGGGGLWSPGRRGLTVGLVLTITLVAFEALAVSTIMPIVADELDGLELYGWVFIAFMLGSLIGIVLVGGLIDRRGLGGPFAAGIGLFAIGLIIGGLAPTMEILVAARFLQGLGAGTVPPIAYVAIGRSLPEHLRPQMFATLSTAWVLPGVLGPAIAGIVGEAVGWRWVFLGLLPLIVVSSAIAFPAVRRIGAGPVRCGERGRPCASAPPLALVVALGTGLLLAGLTSGVRDPGRPVRASGHCPGGLRPAPPDADRDAARRTRPPDGRAHARHHHVRVLRGRSVCRPGPRRLARSAPRPRPASRSPRRHDQLDRWLVDPGAPVLAPLVRDGSFVSGSSSLVAGLASFMVVLLPEVTPWLAIPTFALAGLRDGPRLLAARAHRPARSAHGRAGPGIRSDLPDRLARDGARDRRHRGAGRRVRARRQWSGDRAGGRVRRRRGGRAGRRRHRWSPARTGRAASRSQARPSATWIVMRGSPARLR